MVHMGQMTEFMNDDVIQYGRRGKHQPPVKGEGSFAAAASPPRFLVADGDTVVNASGHGVIIGGTFRDIGTGRFFVALFQRVPLYGGQVGDRPAVFPVADFQIMRYNPAAFFFRKTHDFPFARAKRHAEQNIAVPADGNGHRFASAFYNGKRKRVFASVMGNSKCMLHLASFLRRAPLPGSGRDRQGFFHDYFITNDL